MENFQTPKHPSKNKKRRLTQDQVKVLERHFTTTKKLEPDLKTHLANQLGVPPRQIAIWYQNKRARWKSQSLEIDHNTLQVKLENALADKRRLEEDVKQLQWELRKVQDMLLVSSDCDDYQKAPDLHPTFGDYNGGFYDHQDHEGGSSTGVVANLHDHDQDAMSQDDGHGQPVLQVDELYDCLIGNQL